ncbi:MAG: Carboxylesterase 2 [Alphaproteobacteria bacterium MarineAlpha3_Bin5]|nr:phospholipase [Magnetovibrio sp.]PPR77920.1 MAG: Carboxylesterase 2 [Alphaproteobacteria bacterium MarineAlpha3_Bin5]
MDKNVKLSGASRGPITGGKPEQLVIMAHGVGADGNDLINLANYFEKVLPNAIFVAPNAPETFDGGPPGYQWFSLSDPSYDQKLKGLRNASKIFNQFIDDQLAATGLSEKETALVGFSQGTMLALWSGLRRPRKLAGILGFSGALIGDTELLTELKSKPPVLLIHGQADSVVPFDAMEQALNTLRNLGVKAEGLARPEVGHNLDDDGIKAGMFFLADCFDIDLQSLRR